MQLITSGAYIDSELQSEFGEIPPSFLPLGNKRLFEYQREILNSDLDCILSVPESYSISDRDRKRLGELNVSIVPVPIGLNLGDSIVFVLNYAGLYNEPLSILHGDTLFGEMLRDAEDWFSIAQPADNYNWGRPKFQAAKHDCVFSGFFSFSDASLFVKSLLRCGGNFIEAIHAYADEIVCEYCNTMPWYDFGHTKTYYRSKAQFTTQRHFNDLLMTPLTVTKSSSQTSKIRAESNWFRNLPLGLKPYAPSLYSYTPEEEDACNYTIEYLPLSSLNELYVFGELPEFAWDGIFDACNDFIVDCQQIRPTSELNLEIDKFCISKTQKRLEEFSNQQGVDLDTPWKLNSRSFPSLNQIVALLQEAIAINHETELTAFHGDFCFSNILYDFRQQRIRVIDPRGIDFAGKNTIWGDLQYDVAKLSHSVVGLYDFIICGYYDLTTTGYEMSFSLPSDARIHGITSLFREREFGGISADSRLVKAIEVSLFLSMLPLHNDCRKKQFALLANGLRLFGELMT